MEPNELHAKLQDNLKELDVELQKPHTQWPRVDDDYNFGYTTVE